MRISNINDYLGGANQIVAKELIDGDQYILPFGGNFPNGDPIPFDAVDFDLDYEVFQGSLTQNGSNYKINNMTKVPNVPGKTLNHAVVISGEGSGKFNMFVPTFMLTQFGTNSVNFGGFSDTTHTSGTNFVVDSATLSGTLPASGQLAVSYNELDDDNNTVAVNKNFAYDSFTVSNDTYTFVLSSTQEWATTSRVQYTDNVRGSTETNITPAPDTDNPLIVAQSLRWKYEGAIRTIRFLWVMRYSPNVS